MLYLPEGLPLLEDMRLIIKLHHIINWSERKNVFFFSFPSFCNYPFVTDFATKLKQTCSAKSIIPLHY